MLRSLPIYAAMAAFVCLSPAETVWAQPGGPSRATPVVVQSVIERDVAEDIVFVGTVHPSQTSVVGSAVDGRVEEMLVDTGDSVIAGQELVKLRVRTIELEIEAAEAELKLRKIELAELEEGSRPEEKAQAEAVFRRSEALLTYASSRLARTEALPESASSTEELEQDRSAADAAEQAMKEAKAAWELVLEGPRKEKILLADAKVKAQDIEVERLNDRKSKYTIKAPFAGYIVAKHAEVGQWLSTADPVVEVVAADPIEVWVSVPEDHIAGLKPDGAATVQLDAIRERFFPASIFRIVPQADVRSRSFPVRLRPTEGNPRNDHGHDFMAGMLARVALAVGPPRMRVLVHKDALVMGGEMPVVWKTIFDKETRTTIAIPVPVTLGVPYGPYMRVNGDLQAGQDVVVEGNERLRPGVPVRTVRRPHSED